MAKNNSELFAEWAQQFLGGAPTEDQPEESKEPKEPEEPASYPSLPDGSPYDKGNYYEPSTAEKFAEWAADHIDDSLTWK